VKAFVLMLLMTASTFAQTPPPATFKSAVDLVRIAAVVRDQKGRFVNDLTQGDFEIVDGSEQRKIVDFRHESDGLSLALLFDVSGSMESRMGEAREAAANLFGLLDSARDEAAVFTFDTELVEIVPFTTGLRALPASMSHVVPFGATSLHDAVAATAERVSHREGRRRAVAVLTDGNDNASRLKAAEVSAIASAIDVPVYIFGIVSSLDNPNADIARPEIGSPFKGRLEELAMWTGGRVFVASTSADRSLAARQLIDELRHQYVLAFESSGRPGWHPLVVRVHGRDLKVRARGGYSAGQSSPNAF